MLEKFLLVFVNTQWFLNSSLSSSRTEGLSCPLSEQVASFVWSSAKTEYQCLQDIYVERKVPFSVCCCCRKLIKCGHNVESTCVKKRRCKTAGLTCTALCLCMEFVRVKNKLIVVACEELVSNGSVS